MKVTRATLEERVDKMTEFARAQLEYASEGNWISVTFSHDDNSYQYAWRYKDGALVVEQCDNICPMPDLNIRSRAEKQKHYGTKPDITILASDSRKSRHPSRPSRWQVVKQIVSWLASPHSE